MVKLKDIILKQHSIGQGWGRFALAGSQISVIVSSLTLLMAATSAYVPLSAWLLERGLSLQFWVFISLIIVPIIIAFFLAWKFLVVSFYRSSVDQFMTQNKELTDSLKKVAEMEKLLSVELPAIRQKLTKLEKK